MPRGRSDELILLRNEALLRRYLYWTEIQRRRFDDVLLILSRYEFFISDRRIMAIINANHDRLDELRLELLKKPKKRGRQNDEPVITPPKQLTFFADQEKRFGQGN